MSRWPNGEVVLIGALSARLGLPVFSEESENLEMPAEWVRVARSGGGQVAGQPIPPLEREQDLEVAVHARSRARMWALVRETEEALADVERVGPFDALVERFGFGVDPYPGGVVRRASATVTVTVRPSA